jgi:hypothetical protein
VLRNRKLALEGKTGVIVNFFFDYQLVKMIYDSGWYDKFKMILESDRNAIGNGMPQFER